MHSKALLLVAQIKSEKRDVCSLGCKVRVSNKSRYLLACLSLRRPAILMAPDNTAEKKAEVVEEARAPIIHQLTIATGRNSRRCNIVHFSFVIFYKPPSLVAERLQNCGMAPENKACRVGSGPRRHWDLDKCTQCTAMMCRWEAMKMGPTDTWIN